jgi:hypothetical protein
MGTNRHYEKRRRRAGAALRYRRWLGHQANLHHMQGIRVEQRQGNTLRAAYISSGGLSRKARSDVLRTRAAEY